MSDTIVGCTLQFQEFKDIYNILACVFICYLSYYHSMCSVFCLEIAFLKSRM